MEEKLRWAFRDAPRLRRQHKLHLLNEAGVEGRISEKDGYGLLPAVYTVVMVSTCSSDRVCSRQNGVLGMFT